MRLLLSILFISITLYSCEEKAAPTPIDPVNWSTRVISLQDKDSLIIGNSYLSVYSEIYSVTEHRTINLTTTVSLRNVSSNDSVYITKADYHNTNGDLIRSYLKSPIYIKPLETIEIIINEKDMHGGSGANFIFDWATHTKSIEPHFEAVMITTSGQQGISFTTQGIKR